MKFLKWDKLPEFMKCEEVKEYYDILSKKRMQIAIKRIFDIIISLLLLIVFLLPMILIAILIKLDSEGPIFYRQERATLYGKKFRIHKFRTMVNNADKIGSTVTIDNDDRITSVGKKIRKLRVDEFPQLIDVLKGDMSFVGTRPEALKYIKSYSNEMMATLLMPAGITSEASIRYKDEEKILNDVTDVDKIYIEKVLPHKMKYNLLSIKEFSIVNDVKILFKTLFVVLGKE